ncbi:MAG: choice-of-anchor D domain-containing protein [Myxococcota bacterium]
MKRICFLAVAVLAGGCEDETTLVQQEAELELGSESLDFGTVPLGATKRLRVAVRNLGQRALSATVQPPSAPFFVDRQSFEVPPGGSVSVDLGFAPERIDPASESLAFETSGGNGVVSLRGEGEASEVTVTPREVDLRGVEVGDVASIELFFEHRGRREIAGDLVTEGFERPLHFALSGFAGFQELGSISFSPRSEFVTDLSYRPLSPGADAGILRFEYCGTRCGAEVRITASGTDSALVFEPSVLDFGGVGVGEQVTLQVLTRNLGDASIELRAFAVDGDPSFRVEATPTVLEPGDVAPIRVTYQPDQPEPHAAEVLVTTDASRFSARGIPVRGEGLGPRFGVHPERVSFGVSAQAEPASQSLVMTNSGSAAVEVQSVDLVGQAAFSMELPELPLVLGAGESAFARVRFQPSTVGTFTGTVSARSSDPESPRIEVPVRAVVAETACLVELEPTTLNFGLIQPGRTRQANLRIENVGSEECIVDASLEEPSDPHFGLDAVPTFVLSPGANTEVSVSFSPTSRRSAKGVLQLRTNDPLEAIRRVSLTGTSEGYSSLVVLPEILDFGVQRLDCQPSIRTLRMINTGILDIGVGTVRWDPENPAFSVSGPNSTVLAPGMEQRWTVQFTPAVGPQEAELRFGFEDLPFPQYVPVLGEGALEGRRTDRFEQRAIRETDVLFVIDDSPSMLDDQEALARNVERFIREADLEAAGFRIGITTTSVTLLDGQLVGPVIDGSALSRSRAISEFTRQAVVGAEGSGFEESLESALRALERAAGGSDRFAGLLDRQAVVALVIVTDEDDFSPGSAAFYAQRLDQLTPDGWVTAVVSGGVRGCLTATPSPKLTDFLALSQGTFLSICGDWGDNLELLGRIAFGLDTRFPLSEAADPNRTIEVRVDGFSVGDWTYDFATQSIRFEVPPGEGSEIRVEYSPACP